MKPGTRARRLDLQLTRHQAAMSRRKEHRPIPITPEIELTFETSARQLCTVHNCHIGRFTYIIRASILTPQKTYHMENHNDQ